MSVDPNAGSAVVCSRAGCRAPAAWLIIWRNPRIHDISRTKTWTACEEHREYLEHFLRLRGFPVEVSGIGEPPLRREDGA